MFTIVIELGIKIAWNSCIRFWLVLLKSNEKNVISSAASIIPIGFWYLRMYFTLLTKFWHVLVLAIIEGFRRDEQAVGGILSPFSFWQNWILIFTVSVKSPGFF